MLLREYEISVWEDILSDDKTTYNEHPIAVIGSNTMTSDCAAQDAHFNKKTTGEYTLSFILYTQYFDKTEGTFVDNPFIKLLVNERKIKLHYKDQWYDFVIKNIVEDSDGKSYTYTAQALFINELSKNGIDIVFSAEKENSIGNITTLAAEALKGTDWQVSDQSDLIRQTTVEPLYVLTTTSQITATSVMSNTTKEIIPAGSIIYGFYSCLSNKDPFFQFLYRSDGKYEINTDTGAIMNSSNWYIDNTSYTNSEGTPSFCKNEKAISLDYRGKKFIRSTESFYDSKVDEFISVYQDSTGKEIRGYTKTEYLSPTFTQNLITNSSNFESTTGWDKEGSTYIRSLFHPPLVDNEGKDLKGQALINALATAKLTLQFNLQSGDRFHNSGLVDNRKLFVKNGIALGEKYVLRLKLSGASVDESHLKGFVAFYDGMVDGKYDIQKNGSTEIHIFDFAAAQNISNNEGYILRVASATQAITYQQMLTKNLGIFFETDIAGTYIFEQIDFFKYYEQDGKILYPETVPSAEAQTIYYYYDPNKNKDATSADEIQYEYVGASPSTDFSLKYDENCEKRRSYETEKTNRFNILQDLAELFECWIDFVIEHNEDGSVKKDKNGIPQKYVIFRNYVGIENFAGFHYGINLQSIERTVDSDQICSKIVVEDNDNEFATDGYCSISRAVDNPTGELFFYDFRHYYTQGLLNYSELMNDLYLEVSPWLGYYVKMKRINQTRQALLEEASAIANSMNTLSASSQTHYLIYTEGSTKLNDKKQELANYPPAKGYIYEDFIKNPITDEYVISLIEHDPEIIGIITAIAILERQVSQSKKFYNTYKEAYDTAQARYKEIQELLEASKTQKEELNKKFYEKYSRFIQEGSWSSEDYLDDNLYYYDAAATLAESANPQITYSINAIDVGSLEGLEGYTFNPGDRTYIEDTEFFGFTYIDGVKTPVQEEIVVSEIDVVLNDPSQDTITVQNYKTRFEDMFQRISTTTTSLQYQSGSYARAANAITKTGEIKAETLQQSFANNAFTLANAGDQTVLWNENGITVSSPRTPNQIVRIINGGIYLTKDGGTTWSAAITGAGINASYINAGQIDTSLIRIMNGAFPTYKWDGNGLSAYWFSQNSDGSIGSINYGKFVRFDQYGIYGMLADDENWVATNLNDVKTKAKFGLTWDGFFLKNGNDSGQIEISSDKDITVSAGGYDRIKIGKIGNNNYGLSINDATGAQVLATESDGSLWLKNKLSVSTSLEGKTVQIGYLNDIDEKHGHQVINAADNFIVYEDGHLLAKSGEFTGTINATGGKIGNLTIEELENSGYTILITSDKGTVFKNDYPETINLTCEVYKGGEKINDSPAHTITYQWQKNHVDILDANQMTYEVKDEDVTITAIYTCIVNIA